MYWRRWRLTARVSFALTWIRKGCCKEPTSTGSGGCGPRPRSKLRRQAASRRSRKCARCSKWTCMPRWAWQFIPGVSIWKIWRRCYPEAGMTEAERIYYDRRAAEYDDWYLGTGLFAARVRPGWHAEVDALRTCIQSLSIRSVLDVACGTGFLTQHLAGRVVALDQSLAMLRIARGRVPGGCVLQGDAL